jgi:hypothetical protein
MGSTAYQCEAYSRNAPTLEGPGYLHSKRDNK